MLSIRSVVLGMSVLAGSSTVARAADLSTLEWLAGCWSADGAETGSVEHWLPPAGDALFGISRTVRNGETVAHEFMQIRKQADGSVAFTAQPSGQPTAVFPLLRMTATEVVFENLQHDFPQRIVYASIQGSRLDARIEGVRNGERRSIGFPMSRVSCDARDPPAHR